jgi:hypothetical protein
MWGKKDVVERLVSSIGMVNFSKMDGLCFGFPARTFLRKKRKRTFEEY